MIDTSRQSVQFFRNSRSDQLHKLPTTLIEVPGAIFIGNANASALANKQTSKSAWDAGWSALRTLLQYKRDQGNIWFDEVDEAYSSSYTRGCCKGAPA